MLQGYRKFLTSIILVCFFSTLIGQSPYELRLKEELVYMGLGVVGEMTGTFIGLNLQPLDISEIDLLNANTVNGFDRDAVKYNSRKARLTSDVLLYSSYAYPLLFLMDKKGKNDMAEIGIIATEVVIINAALTTLVKVTAKRVRPLVYNPNVSIDKKTSRSARLSFYSGHTSSVASMAFFTAKVFSDYHPDSKWKPLVWTGAVLLPAATGYSRLRGGKHFPTDVMTGLVAGALVGYIIPQLHKKKKKNPKVTFSVFTGSNELGLTLNW